MIYIMKQEGLYQSKVNSSLISIRNYMYSCTLYKMDYWWKRGAYRIWVHVCTCSALIWRRLLQASGVLTIPLRSPGFYKAPSPWVSCELTLIWTGPFLVHVRNFMQSPKMIFISTCFLQRQDFLSRSLAPFTKKGFSDSNFLCFIFMSGCCALNSKKASVWDFSSMCFACSVYWFFPVR